MNAYRYQTLLRDLDDHTRPVPRFTAATAIRQLAEHCYQCESADGSLHDLAAMILQRPSLAHGCYDPPTNPAR